MIWPAAAIRCIVLLFVVLTFGSAAFLNLVWPSASFLLALASAAVAIPLLIFSLEALFRFRWRWVVIFTAVWLVVIPPFFGFSELTLWLSAQGFHLRTLFTRDYLASCRLVEFVEDGAKQSAGVCEGIDEGSLFEMIVYDTSKQVILPVVQRTPEWKDAMLKAGSGQVVVSEENRAQHLFGNFYAVYIALDEW